MAGWRRFACLFATALPLAASFVHVSSNVAAERFSEEERGHWAFQPVARPAVPAVKRSDLIRTPIDAFLLSRLEPAGLSFSSPADRRTLLRRVKFDLHGLPPTPDEVAEFMADDAPDAWERLIERLLASPHYGEHWGRLWLDVVRYAETAGYNADPLRPNSWKFRDFVVASLNADKPFDRFVQEQIAGDELFPDDEQAVLGSGYLLLWPDESNASNVLLARQDALNDLTGNVGAAFLGLSVGCAQCHDHKFDPIPQADFYRLQAFFSGLIRRERAEIGTAEQLVAYRQACDLWLAEAAPIRDELRQLESEPRLKISAERRMKFPQIVLEAMDTPLESRTPLQRQLCFWSERQVEVKDSEIVAQLNDAQRTRRAELHRQLTELQKRHPQPPAAIDGMIAGEIASNPPTTYLLSSGSYDKPLREVEPGYLSVLFHDSGSDASFAAPHPHTSGRRSALARWLTDPRHPLVPRVLVNRVWQAHFGRGLVENGNDFGVQTPRPLHPELLDWLAAEFVSPQTGVSQSGPPASHASSTTPGDRGTEADLLPNAWSLKHLHRLIVTSAAYRQSTDSTSAGDMAHRVDAGNLLYWHFPRQRLAAESVRDALLAISGQLNPAVYGPSVFPELPSGFTKREAWKVSAEPTDRNRRSIYIHAKRNLPYPLLEAFDLPDMHESCARRTQTTVAPQALLLLNSEMAIEAARTFAGRLLHENPQVEGPRAVADAYRLAFGREPLPAESDLAVRFLAEQADLAASRLSGGAPILLPRHFPKFLDPARAAALVDFCHALLNASEFLYLD